MMKMQTMCQQDTKAAESYSDRCHKTTEPSATNKNTQNERK